MPGTALIHLIRHGETETYGADAGLTARGAEQSAGRGRALAAAVAPRDLLGIEHAPTERARQTAVSLLSGYVSALGLARPDPRWEPNVAHDFRNLQVLVDGGEYEPTAIRWLLEKNRPLAEDAPGWMVEADRFWRAHDVEGDAMRFWLTTPLLWHESPAATVARIIRAAHRRSQRVDRDGHLFVAGHSGCLRALVHWASGADPGEPANTGEVLLSVSASERIAEIGYDTQVWRMQVPFQLLSG